MKALTDKFGIKHEFSSPYQHQSNGLAERTIRTLRDMVVTSMSGDPLQRNWEELIQKIEFAINATYQSTIGCTPFEIIFGRKILIHGMAAPVENKNTILKNATENSKKAADNMRIFEENKRVQRAFSVGEEVLVKMEPHNQKKSAFRYEGPYKILEFISPYQVLLDFPKKPMPRRIEWLKHQHKQPEGEVKEY